MSEEKKRRKRTGPNKYKSNSSRIRAKAKMDDIDNKDENYNRDGTPKKKESWVEDIMSSLPEGSIYGTEIRY